MSNMTRGFFEPDRFELLDSLPKPLRLALAMADYDWCVASFVEDYEETGSVAKTIAYVREADRHEHRRTARRERRIIFGARGQIYT